jgi:hypothetical protein
MKFIMGISTNDFESRKYNWRLFQLFAKDKLDAKAGISGFGKVFKVTNIKTKEIKVLKAIQIMNLAKINMYTHTHIHIYIWMKIYDIPLL